MPTETSDGRSSASRKATLGLLSRPLQYEVMDPKRFTGQLLRMGGTVLGTTNKGRRLRLPHAGRFQDRPVRGDHRGLPAIEAGRADRHWRRRELRDIAPAGAAGRHPPGRHSEDHRQRCGLDRVGRRPCQRGCRRHRGARPSPADGGEPRPGDGAGSDGPGCGPYRPLGGNCRRSRRHPDTGDSGRPCACRREDTGAEGAWTQFRAGGRCGGRAHRDGRGRAPGRRRERQPTAASGIGWRRGSRS